MTNKVAFAVFPFTHKGVHFVSKIAETSSSLSKIVNLGEVFITMNKNAVDELMPDLEDMSWASIEKELVRINEGGTEMFLELVGME